MSGDGDTLAVGASSEDNSTGNGVNPQDRQSGDTANNSGAVYVFVRNTRTSEWSQQAYIKASNTEAGDLFGGSLSMSDDGGTLAVGAINEDSNGKGVNPRNKQANNDASASGAVYIY